MNEKNLTTLTIEEIAEILCYKDTRQIKIMIERGTLPSLTLDRQNMTIKAQELADFLGVEDLNESFMTLKQAQEFLGLKTKLSITYCKEKGIPFTTLGNTTMKGRRALFRKSLLEKWKSGFQVVLDENNDWIESQARLGIKLKMLPFMIDFINLIGLTFRQTDTLTRYLRGTPLAEIADDYGTTTSRVQQILDRAVTNCSHAKREFEKFSETKFAKEFMQDPVLFLEKNENNLEQKKVLISQLQEKVKLLETTVKEGNHIVPLTQAEQDSLNMIKLLSTEIGDLDFSVRTFNCLFYRAKIETLKELVQLKENDLLKFRNFGRKSVAEIENKLIQKGLHFGMDISKYFPEEFQE